MPDRMSDRMSHHIYFQMLRQKLCQNIVSRWGSLEVKYFWILCSTFPKTDNVSREYLRGKAERSQGKKKGKEKEQFRKNKQGKARQADKEEENRKMKETQKKKRKGRKKEGTAKHDSVLTFFFLIRRPFHSSPHEIP